MLELGFRHLVDKCNFRLTACSDVLKLLERKVLVGELNVVFSLSHFSIKDWKSRLSYFLQNSSNSTSSKTNKKGQQKSCFRYVFHYLLQ